VEVFLEYIPAIILNLYLFPSNFVSVVLRRTNELKADIDIPNDVIMKFKQFWSDFNDTPLKGKNYSQCSYL